MTSIALILYFIGLIGICISILILGFKIHKKNSILNIIVIIIVFVSFSSLGGGTILSLINIRHSSESGQILRDDLSSNKLEKKEASYSDLNLIYKFSQSNTKSLKEAYITIDNNSAYVFSGDIFLEFLDENNTLVSTITLPVRNLTPSSSTRSTVQVDGKVTKMEYYFNGDFSDAPENNTSTYFIKNMAIGGDFLRFELLTENHSPENLQSICKEFKETYNSSLCKGFLIYFIDGDGKSFNNSYAEFYGDNIKSDYTLTIFKNNEQYKIR